MAPVQRFRRGLAVLLVLATLAATAACAPDSESDQAGQGERRGETQYVTAPSGLRLRDAPGLDAAQLALIPVNQPVEILERSEHTLTVEGRTAPWARVRYGALEGWVFSGYLEGERKSQAELRSEELFVGEWLGENVCNGDPTKLTVGTDRRFTMRLFGGCDISGCDCIKIAGDWRVEDERICFLADAKHAGNAAPEGEACYRRAAGDRLELAGEGAFRENFGSESVESLSRKSQ